MKRLTYILSILALLLAFSYNANATRQVRDIIIINKVEHGLNKVLRFMGFWDIHMRYRRMYICR